MCSFFLFIHCSFCLEVLKSGTASITSIGLSVLDVLAQWNNDLYFLVSVVFCDIDNKAIVFINITLFIIYGLHREMKVHSKFYVVEYVNTGMLSLQNIYLDQEYACIS